jgi:hypothetical protein
MILITYTPPEVVRAVRTNLHLPQRAYRQLSSQIEWSLLTLKRVIHSPSAVGSEIYDSEPDSDM